MSSQQQLQQKKKTTYGQEEHSFLKQTYFHDEFKLTIQFSETFAFITKIWIFNNNLKLMVRPENEIGQTSYRVYPLPADKYIVRIDINGQIEDNEVELYSDKTCIVGYSDSSSQRLAVPRLYSSALLGGELEYESSHEYYTEPSIEISKGDYKSYYEATIQNSGLFIFLRYPNAQIYQELYKSKAYWERFSLLNKRGEVIVTFPTDCILDNNPFGWNLYPGSGYIGFTASLPPDLYFLQYDNDPGRIVPIYVYENWFTQFFMTMAEEPLFGSIRIFLSWKKEFDPFEKNNYNIDICLNKIQNNDFTLEKELLENIAYGKFESPMLGLLGSYIYLNSNETKNDELFQTIVNNLQRKILKNSSDAPDIWALNLLSYKHFNKTISNSEKKVVNGTPMLRIAFKAIRDAAINTPWLIPEGSLNDYIAEYQMFDSPYNTFKPKKERKFFNKPKLISFEVTTPEFAIQNELEDLPLEPQESLQVALDTDKIFLSDLKDSPPIINLSEKQKKDLKSKLSHPENIGKIGYAIISSILQNENISIGEMAQNLNVPQNTIARIKKQMGM